MPPGRWLRRLSLVAALEERRLGFCGWGPGGGDPGGRLSRACPGLWEEFSACGGEPDPAAIGQLASCWFPFREALLNQGLDGRLGMRRPIDGFHQRVLPKRLQRAFSCRELAGDASCRGSRCETLTSSAIWLGSRGSR